MIFARDLRCFVQIRNAREIEQVQACFMTSMQARDPRDPMSDGRLVKTSVKCVLVAVYGEIA